MKRYISLFFVLCAMMLAGMDLSAQTAPSRQARYLTFSGTTASSVNVGWYNGNGDGRIVVVKADDNVWTDEDNAIAALAVAPTTDPNGVYNAQGIQAVGAGFIVDVVEGTNRTSSVSSLPNSGTTYFFKVYEFNKVGSVYDYNVTDGTAMNPRPKATLAGAYGPLLATVTDDGANANANGQWANLSWISSMGNDAEWDLSIYNNANNTVFDGYEELDLGILSAGSPESFQAYIGTAGTYYAKVRSRFNNQLGSWISSENFTIVTPTDAPAFDLTNDFTMTQSYGSVVVTFDRAVTANSIGAIAANLAAEDFGIDFTKGTGTATGASIWRVVKTENRDDQYTLYIRFTGRANGNEKIVIRPADNYSIFGTNGVAMNANNNNIPAGNHQVTNEITCHKATVLVDNDNTRNGTEYAYFTIADALLNAAPSNYVVLMDGETYSETVAVNKAVTMTDDGGQTNANVTGSWTLNEVTSGTIAVNHLAFAPTSGAAVTVSGVSGTTVNLDGNAFATDAGEYGINVYSTRGVGALTALNIGATTTNTFTGAGDAIYFSDPIDVANGITAITIQKNTFNNTGLAISFEAAEDFTTVMPVINLGTTAGTTANTYHVDNDGVTPKYVYSGSTLVESEFLYPGIAVLGIADATTLLNGTAVAYFTPNLAITASANNSTQSVFLGEGTYDETIALNEAVNLVGKGAFADGGTKCTNVLTISGVATFATTVSNILFDVQNTNGIVIAASPATSTININNISVDYQAGDVAINVTAATVAGNISIAGGSGSNNFTKSFAVNGGDATGTAIVFPNNQITGTVSISENNFQFNSTGVDKGIYFSTTNSTGISTGTIAITGNQFQEVTAYVVDNPATTDVDETDGWNAKGDAIVFEDAVNITANPSFHMNQMTAINIYNNNVFQNVGYAIKINESSSCESNIASTMPVYIDLFGTSANVQANPVVTLTGSKIYGAAWYDLTLSDIAPDPVQNNEPQFGFPGNAHYSKLYPSIQCAENVILPPVQGGHTLYIGEGTYSEDVTFDNANLSILAGAFNKTCELSDKNTATLSKDFTSIANFLAYKVVLGANAAQMTDALVLVKERANDKGGDIKIANNVITSDAATVSKKVIISEVAASTGTYSGTLTIAKGGVDVNYLTFTGNPAITVAMDNKNNESISIANNIFTMAQGTSAAYADLAKAIVIEAGNATSAPAAPIATNGFPVNITGNTFNGVSNTFRTAIAITNTNANQTFATFSGVNVYNTNVFNNDGYSFYQSGLNNVCALLPTIDIKANAGNTYGANLLAKHFKGFYYDPILVNNTTTAEVLNMDCTAPADFTTGTTLAYNDATANSGTSVIYWNSHDTKLQVTVPLTKINNVNDESLVHGNIQVYMSKDTTFADQTTRTLGEAHTITSADLTAGTVTLEFTAAEFEGNPNVLVDLDRWKFRAKITDMSELFTNGAASNSITVDQTVPVLTLTNPQINGQRMQTFSLAVGSKEDAVYPTFEFSSKYTTANPDVWWDGATQLFNSNTEVKNPINDWSGTNWTYSFAPNTTGDYIIYLKAADLAGNTVTLERSFLIDNTKPKVDTLIYVNTATLIAKFDEAVELNKANIAANYVITLPNNTTVTPTTAVRGMVSGTSDNQVTLTFPAETFNIAALDQCQTLLLTVNSVLPNGVRDLAGNLLDATGRGVTLNSNSGLNYNQVRYLKPDTARPYVVSISRKDPNLANSPYLTKAETVKFQVVFSEPVRVNNQVFAQNGAEFIPDAQTMAQQFEVIGEQDPYVPAPQGYQPDPNPNVNGTRITDATSTDNITWEFTLHIGPNEDGAVINIAPIADNRIYDMPMCGAAINANHFDQGANQIAPNHSYKVDRKAPAIADLAPKFFTHPVAGDYWRDAANTISWNLTNITDGTGLADNSFELYYTTDATAGTPVWTPITTNVLAKTAVDYSWTPANNDNTTKAAVKLTATDLAGNTNSIISSQFVLDNTKPTVTIAASKALLNETDNNGTFTVTATFNENMKADVAPVLAFSPNPVTGHTLDLVPANTGWNVGDNKTVYTWTFGVTDQNANFADVDITVTMAQDLATNVMNSTTEENEFSIDMQDAVLSSVAIISNNTTNTNYAKNGDKVTVTFTADKALDIETVTTPLATTATIGGRTATVSLVSGLNYKAEYTIPAGEAILTEEALSFSIIAVSATGNTSAPVTTTNNNSSVTYDRTAPSGYTVSINQGDYINSTNVNAVGFTFAGAEVNTTYNYTFSDASAQVKEVKSNGTITTATDNITGINLSSLIDGTINLSVTLTDRAGNVGTAATDAATKDVVVPTATVATSVNPIYEGALTQTVTVTYSEAMTGTPTITLSGVNWGNATNGAWNAVNTPVNGTVANTIYTAQFTHTATQEEIADAKATVAKAAVTDVAGNTIADAVNSTPTFLLDNQKPTVEFALATNQTNPASGNEAKFKLTFSEKINPATMSIFDYQYFTNGTLSATGLSYTKLSDTEYQVNVTGLTGSGDVWIQLLDNKVTDMVGNANVASAISLKITYDNTPPTVTALSPLDNATGVANNANLVMTFSENVQKGTGNIVIYNANATVFQTIDVTTDKVSIVNNVVTISHDNFVCGDSYYVQMASGVIKDMVGPVYAGINNATTWNFSAVQGGTVSIADINAQNAVCQGSSIALEATVSPANGDITVQSYLWSGPNGFSAITEDASIPVAASDNGGEYTLLVTFSTGCTATASKTVTVNPTPDAPTAQAQVFCSVEAKTVADLVITFVQGNTLKFYDAAVAGNVILPTAALTTRTYYVSQTTPAGCEGPRGSVAVTVNQTPNAPTAQAQTFCSADAPKVSNLATTNGSNIKWYATAQATEALLGNVALATGTYYATQTVNGCESAKTPVSVTVNPTPDAPTAQAQTFCSASNPTVANLVTTNGSNIKWYAALTGGNALLNTVALLNNTTYYASQTENTCESARTAVLVTITNSITPTVSVTSNPAHNANALTICDGTSVTFTATPANLGGGTASYEWFIGANKQASTTNVFTTSALVNANEVTCKVTVANGNCLTATTATSTAITATVNPLPVPEITANPVGITPNQNTQVTYSTAAGMTNYAWTISGTINEDYTKTLGTATDNSVVITWLTAGPKTVSVNYTNANGCTATAATVENVTVQSTDAAAEIVTEPSDASTCDGTATSFTVVANGNPGPTYKWFVKSTDQGADWTEITAANAGNVYTTYNTATLGVTPTAAMNNYTYKVQVANTANVNPAYDESLVRTLTVTAKETPSVSIVASVAASNGISTITSGTSVTFTATPLFGGGNPTYQWYKGQNPIANATSNEYTSNTLADGNMIWVKMTSILTCVTSATANSNQIEMDVITVPTATIANGGKTSSWLKFDLTAGTPAPNGVLVIMQTTSNSYTAPQQGRGDYSASLIYGAGTPVGAGFVVYDGPATGSFTVSGLVNNSTYYLNAYPYYRNGNVLTSTIYGTPASANNKTLRKEGVEIEEPLATSNFELCKVNPNPVSTEINFCIDAFDANNYTIELFSSNGELMLAQSQNLTLGNHSMKLNLMTEKGRLAAGTYFLKVTAGAESLTQQVVVLP